MSKHQYNFVLQKEYLIIEPSNPKYLLGTESVRGCCGVFIYHPTRSAVLHWDDNCCHLDLDLFVKKFLSDSVELKDCTVTLVGGWVDSVESKKSAEFVKDYFENTPAKLDLSYFLKKQSKGPLLAQGYKTVFMNARSGEMTVKDNWSKDININDGKKYRGDLPIERYKNNYLQDHLHLQGDQLEDSGTHIYARDNYKIIQEKQSLQLCIAARENKFEDVIKHINGGIIGVNISPPSAKGWTALHYACRLKHFELAILLINNGADLFQKNDIGKTPLNYVTEGSVEYRRLMTAFRLVKIQSNLNLGALRSISLFSRNRGQLLEPEDRMNCSKLQELLKTEQGLSEIEKQLEVLSKIQR